MELVTKNKTIKLVFTTRKLVNVTNMLKGKNFEDLYFKAINENDLEALSKIIYVFAEDVENGSKSFKSSEEVYDFIDDYKAEQNKTYQDIFEEIAVVISDEGFFKTKMTKKEVMNRIADPLAGIDMNEIIRKSTETATNKVIESEMMQEYKH